MLNSKAIFALLACALLGACAGQISGPPLAGTPLALASVEDMPQGRAVAAPRGYVDMCGRQASLCANVAPAADPPLRNDDADLVLLDAVNRRVNGSVRQVSDEVAFHRAEYWRPSGDGFGALGDCEDIAIEKRLELRRAGFPDSDMFYAIGYRRDLGLHTVLIAQTRFGEVVLDSRTPYLGSWMTAPYIWVSRQSQTDAAAWRAVERAPEFTVSLAKPPAPSGG